MLRAPRRPRLRSREGPGEEDYKTRLQELCAPELRRAAHLPGHRPGPDHAKVFDAEVFVGGRSEGERGRALQEAGRADGRHATLGKVLTGSTRSRTASEARSGPLWPRTAAPQLARCGRRPLLPELPEVETVRRGLTGRYVGHRLDRVVVTGRRTVRRHPPGLLAQLEGQVLPWRRPPRQVPAVRLGRRPDPGRAPAHERPNAGR